MHLSDATQDFIKERVERFPRFFERINQVHVMTQRQNDLMEVEIVVHPPRGTMVVRERADDLVVAIDRAAEKIERKLVRLKERFSQYRLKKAEAPVQSEAGKGEESYEEIIGSLLEEEEEEEQS
jgi:ribosomal subunit interface protein